jgi:hypothetical protein
MSYSAQGSRLNRRGSETRRRVLDVAIRRLAEGSPEPVTAILIAREAGVHIDEVVVNAYSSSRAASSEAR